MFFVFEGIDGSGKTTQIARIGELIAEELGEDRLVLAREPGGWEGGEALREFVLGGGLANPWSEFFFFMMDRCEHVSRVINPALSSGKVVLCDRYFSSTLAYQVLANPGVPPERANYMMRLAEAVDLPAPDVIFWLDVDVRTAASRLASRGRMDGFDERGRKFFERVRRGYDMLAQADAGRWVKIDARGHADEVFGELSARVMRLLESRYS
jgi:dTMP kinase